MHRPESKIQMKAQICATNQVHENQSIELNGEFCETIFSLPLAPPEHSGIKRNGNPWIICHLMLISELVTSLLIKGIQMGDICRLELADQTRYARHVGRFRVFSAVTFNFQNPRFIPAYSTTLFVSMLA
jgi:hypothetical protein